MAVSLTDKDAVGRIPVTGILFQIPEALLRVAHTGEDAALFRVAHTWEGAATHRGLRDSGFSP